MDEKTLNIVYVGMRYDYGDPTRGSCYEFVHFFETLQRMKGVNARLFPFDEILRREGRRKMNDRLLETADWGADVYFFVLFTDEIREETIDQIAERSSGLTVNWCGDDHWRFQTFSRHWAPHFDWVVTTDPTSVPLYQEAGCTQIIQSQWAFNHFGVVPDPAQEDLDVTFIGQVHSNRAALISKLQRRGVRVHCWGKGWKNGYLTREEMVRTIRRSRINLNFTSGSVRFNAKSIAKVFLNRRADKSIHVRSPNEIVNGSHALFLPHRAQIKGRTFEIPGYGGFLLSEAADGLERYYRPGEEIGVFENEDDLAEKVLYYLSHDEERSRVKAEGHRRTIAEHTYEARFSQIFQTMGIGRFKGSL